MGSNPEEFELVDSLLDFDELNDLDLDFLTQDFPGLEAPLDGLDDSNILLDAALQPRPLAVPLPPPPPPSVALQQMSLPVIKQDSAPLASGGRSASDVSTEDNHGRQRTSQEERSSSPHSSQCEIGPNSNSKPNSTSPEVRTTVNPPAPPPPAPTQKRASPVASVREEGGAREREREEEAGPSLREMENFLAATISESVELRKCIKALQSMMGSFAPEIRLPPPAYLKAPHLLKNLNGLRIPLEKLPGTPTVPAPPAAPQPSAAVNHAQTTAQQQQTWAQYYQSYYAYYAQLQQQKLQLQQNNPQNNSAAVTAASKRPREEGAQASPSALPAPPSKRGGAGGVSKVGMLAGLASATIMVSQLASVPLALFSKTTPPNASDASLIPTSQDDAFPQVGGTGRRLLSVVNESGESGPVPIPTESEYEDAHAIVPLQAPARATNYVDKCGWGEAARAWLRGLFPSQRELGDDLPDLGCRDASPSGLGLGRVELDEDIASRALPGGELKALPGGAEPALVPSSARQLRLHRPAKAPLGPARPLEAPSCAPESRVQLEASILQRIRDIAPAALTLGRDPVATPSPSASAAPSLPPPSDRLQALSLAAFEGLATPAKCSKVFDLTVKTERGRLVPTVSTVWAPDSDSSRPDASVAIPMPPKDFVTVGPSAGSPLLHLSGLGPAPLGLPRNARVLSLLLPSQLQGCGLEANGTAPAPSVYVVVLEPSESLAAYSCSFEGEE